jgi:hypothetical protein
MTPYERELFFELLKKYQDEKRDKEKERFKDQVKFLSLLVVSLIFILVLSGLI